MTGLGPDVKVGDEVVFGWGSRATVVEVVPAETTSGYVRDAEGNLVANVVPCLRVRLSNDPHGPPRIVLL